MRQSLKLNEQTQWAAFRGAARRAGRQGARQPRADQLGADAQPRSEKIEIPVDLAPAVGGVSEKPVSSQAAFGAVMLSLARGETAFADRLLTTAPDVTTTTSLAGFVNKRGVFTTGETERDNFRNKLKGVHSLNNWQKSGGGQHIELGIAENNLLLLMAAEVSTRSKALRSPPLPRAAVRPVCRARARLIDL